MKILLIIMLISLFIAFAWDNLPIVKPSVHFLLTPLEWMLNWNFLMGMIIITFFINLAQTLVHKYTTNQEELKKMKDDQKKFQEEMKQLKNQPDKMLELQKKQWETLPKSFSLSMQSAVYTIIPLILFFRWFNDFFTILNNPKIFLGLGWIGTYILFSIVFSIILKKILKVH